MLDQTTTFYRTFEDAFRGSRELIRQRLCQYAPFIQPLAILYPHGEALDLGCGRGEWLEVISEQGFSARGVDLDDGMLAACIERGLQTSHQDAVSALEACADESLCIVSAFHVAEHISIDALQTLVAEALRTLKPGGILILETPNPENLTVGSCSFYLDPTHQRPIPPQLLAFLPESAGFARSKVVRLQEAPELRDAQDIGLLQVIEGVSPDYAVVAQKAALGSILSAFDSAFQTEYGLTLSVLAQRYESAWKERHVVLGQALEAAQAATLCREEALRNDTQTRLDALRDELQAQSEAIATHADARLQASVAEIRNETAAQRDAMQLRFMQQEDTQQYLYWEMQQQQNTIAVLVEQMRTIRQPWWRRLFKPRQSFMPLPENRRASEVQLSLQRIMAAPPPPKANSDIAVSQTQNPAASPIITKETMKQQPMPSIQHIAELFALDGETFVVEAYRNLLAREPDEHGMRYYLGRLAMGKRKSAVIAQIAKSPECQSVAKIGGLAQLMAEERRVAHWFWQIFGRRQRLEEGLHSGINELARIQQHNLMRLEDTTTQCTHQIIAAVQRMSDANFERHAEIIALIRAFPRPVEDSQPLVITALSPQTTEPPHLSRETVLSLFRAILGREPENEEVIHRHSLLPSAAVLREALIQSDEFQARLAALTEHARGIFKQQLQAKLADIGI
ncbi:methyltransferase domain-containing protein [Thiomonas delicata]|uniref:DUF4214 domain-containing protein n=1 Tax=Thiomonas delicata TaxID=364030 RepID=A0A238DA36_THIDL|nr:methyltransferase domain-containing protein [Thiomonas delicata]SBP90002.1 hypothetical protein THIARS_90152 [Thiomonas delicata]